MSKRNILADAVLGFQYLMSAVFVVLLVLVISILHPISTARALKAAVWE